MTGLDGFGQDDSDADFSGFGQEDANVAWSGFGQEDDEVQLRLELLC